MAYMLSENAIIKEFVDMYNRFCVTNDITDFYKMLGYCSGCYMSRQINIWKIWDILKDEVKAVMEKYESDK